MLSQLFDKFDSCLSLLAILTVVFHFLKKKNLNKTKTLSTILVPSTNM